MPIIKKVKGDLIDMFKKGEFVEIIHGCNCFHNMGAGIARTIAHEFPFAEYVDKGTEFGSVEKLGEYSAALVSVAHNRVASVVNAYTQLYPGRENKRRLYNSIEKVFTKLNNQLDGKLDDDMITGIPKIGAGLAGGDWGIIEEIINRVTPNMNIVLVEWDKS